MGKKRITENHTATEAFKEAVIHHSESEKIPLWRLAIGVDLHPSVLSQALHGKTIYEPGRVKIQKIADRIGFKGDCFQVNQITQVPKD